MRGIFDKWEAELPISLLTKQSRRKFMLGLAQLSALVAGLPTVAGAKPAKGADFPPDLDMNRDPWKTIVVVQNHLFPSDQNSPGAAEINAAKYLMSMLDAPGMDPKEIDFIRNGPKRVNAISTKMYQRLFNDLPDRDREKVLRRIERNIAGRNWLIAILYYHFEALLSDPVYGGNPNGVGWKWLDHQPGYPRPPKNKKYWMLQ